MLIRSPTTAIGSKKGCGPNKRREGGAARMCHVQHARAARARLPALPHTVPPSPGEQ